MPFHRLSAIICIMDEKKGKRTPFWLLMSRTQRENILVVSSLTIAFLILIVIVAVFASVVLSNTRMHLENEVERNFNSLLFDLENGTVQRDASIYNDAIKGVAVYDGRGIAVYSWGGAAPNYPYSEKAAGNGVTLEYNRRADTFEYVRYLRVPTINARFDSRSSLHTSSIIDFSYVLCISFDGKSFKNDVLFILFAAAIGIIAITALYAFILRIYFENRRYKEEMRRQESLVSLGQAARTLTHEIKNPLSAITLQLAILRKLAGDVCSEEIDILEHETKRLVQLTNRVSDFLKNPEGQPVQTDASEMLRSLIPLFAFPIRLSENSLKSAYVLFDPDRLRSVLENVLKNATESCEGRDPEVEASITEGKRNTYVIHVMDRGDGFDGKDSEKLFDPFFTTKIHGSGIGLSISRQFLRARGGDIRLYKRDGGGTDVEITLKKYSLVQELMGVGEVYK